MTATKQTRNKSTAKRRQKSVPAPTTGKTARAPENRRKTGASFGVTIPPEVGKATQFKPGQSGNPGGRPRTHGLLDVLRSSVDETVAKSLVKVLIAEALKGRNPLPAISTIFDRLEGKPKQAIDFNDITQAMANRTPEELLHFAQYGVWPEEERTTDASEESDHES
jgi:hypothetical protein